MVEKKLKTIPIIFKEFSKKEKGNSLDFILAYHKYHFPKKSNRQLLFNRLKFPIRSKKIASTKNKISITDYVAPSYIGLSSKKDSSINLHWSPFALEKDAYNGLDGDELVVFDTTINIQNRDIKLSKFDLIRILKLKTEQLPFDEENPFSWNLHIGTENQNGRDYFGKAGAGLAWKINPYIKAYTMVDLSLHTQKNHYRITPKIGLFNNFNHLRIASTFGYEKDIEHGHLEKVIEATTQYQLKENLSLFAKYNLNHNEKIELGVKIFY